MRILVSDLKQIVRIIGIAAFYIRNKNLLIVAIKAYPSNRHATRINKNLNTLNSIFVYICSILLYTISISKKILY